MNTKNSSGKLMGLKNTVTILEAAKKISDYYNEPVSEADIYQLALENKIKLSVKFSNPIKVRQSKVVNWENTTWALDYTNPPSSPLPKNLRDGDPECPPDLLQQWECVPENLHYKYSPILLSKKIAENKFLNFDIPLKEIDGIWDLPMIGGERKEIEHKYNLLVDGPMIALDNNSVCYIEDEIGNICSIRIHKDEIESSDLMDDFKQIKKQINDLKLSGAEAQKLLAKHKLKYQHEYQNQEELIDDQDTSYFKFLAEYESALALPDDSQIVVRTTEMKRFLNHPNEISKSQIEPEFSRAELIYLIMIDELLKFRKINLDKRGIYENIKGKIEALGLYIHESTISRKIKRLETAKKNQLFLTISSGSPNFPQRLNATKSSETDSHKILIATFPIEKENQLRETDRDGYLKIIAGLSTVKMSDWGLDKSIRAIDGLDGLNALNIHPDEIYKLLFPLETIKNELR